MSDKIFIPASNENDHDLSYHKIPISPGLGLIVCSKYVRRVRRGRGAYYRKELFISKLFQPICIIKMNFLSEKV